MKKCVCFAFVILSLCSFVGCTELTRKSTQIQDEHLSSIDKKIQEFDLLISSQNSSAQDIKKRIEELSQKAADIDANYVKLNVFLEELGSEVEKKDASLEITLSEVQKNINELKGKLEEIGKSKVDLQNQISSLQAQRSRVMESKVERHSEPVKEEAKEIVEHGREMTKESVAEKKPEDKQGEASATTQGKETLQKLLDDALVMYRDGNYKEAIAKWEEVLVIDQENLEAKFNIEIAKEKIKSLSGK